MSHFHILEELFDTHIIPQADRDKLTVKKYTIR